MPKQLFCAQCGEELLHMKKALRKQQRVITVVEPHICSKEDVQLDTFMDDRKEIDKIDLEIKEKETPPNISALFDKFDFVKKTEAENKVKLKEPLSDNRPADSLRKELKTSTAPLGAINQVKNTIPSGSDGSTIDDLETEG